MAANCKPAYTMSLTSHLHRTKWGADHYVSSPHRSNETEASLLLRNVGEVVQAAVIHGIAVRAIKTVGKRRTVHRAIALPQAATVMLCSSMSS